MPVLCVNALRHSDMVTTLAYPPNGIANRGPPPTSATRLSPSTTIGLAADGDGTDGASIANGSDSGGGGLTKTRRMLGQFYRQTQRETRKFMHTYCLCLNNRIGAEARRSANVGGDTIGDRLSSPSSLSSSMPSQRLADDVMPEQEKQGTPVFPIISPPEP